MFKKFIKFLSYNKRKKRIVKMATKDESTYCEHTGKKIEYDFDIDIDELFDTKTGELRSKSITLKFYPTIRGKAILRSLRHGYIFKRRFVIFSSLRRR
jgi:hypothetical protein